jgi:hypothetical protein
MFGSFLKSKKDDNEVTMSLIVLTHKTNTSIKKSYVDFLNQSGTSDNISKIKLLGLFSLSLFLVTSQFLICSKRKNKTALLDRYTNSMINDVLKKIYAGKEEQITEDTFNKFVLLYQDYYSNLGGRFNSYLQKESSNDSDFINYCTSDIFGSSGFITQIFIDRVIASNLVEIRNYVQNELN